MCYNKEGDLTAQAEQAAARRGTGHSFTQTSDSGQRRAAASRVFRPQSRLASTPAGSQRQAGHGKGCSSRRLEAAAPRRLERKRYRRPLRSCSRWRARAEMGPLRRCPNGLSSVTVLCRLVRGPWCVNVCAKSCTDASPACHLHCHDCCVNVCVQSCTDASPARHLHCHGWWVNVCALTHCLLATCTACALTHCLLATCTVCVKSCTDTLPACHLHCNAGVCRKDANRQAPCGRARRQLSRLLLAFDGSALPECIKSCSFRNYSYFETQSKATKPARASAATP